MNAPAEILTLAEDIIAHGDNTAYISRSSSQYVRNVMRSLVDAFRNMETRALHAETVLAELDAIAKDQEPPAKWLDEALRGLARAHASREACKGQIGCFLAGGTVGARNRAENGVVDDLACDVSHWPPRRLSEPPAVALHGARSPSDPIDKSG